jgi:hypothetical protein
VSCSIVVIKGFAVTATVIVAAPDEDADPALEPELEHALNASEPADTMASSAIPLRLLRPISTVPLLLERPPPDLR